MQAIIKRALLIKASRKAMDILLLSSVRNENIKYEIFLGFPSQSKEMPFKLYKIKDQKHREILTSCVPAVSASNQLPEFTQEKLWTWHVVMSLASPPYLP